MRCSGPNGFSGFSFCVTLDAALRRPIRRTVRKRRRPPRSDCPGGRGGVSQATRAATAKMPMKIQPHAVQ